MKHLVRDNLRTTMDDLAVQRAFRHFAAKERQRREEADAAMWTIAYVAWALCLAILGIILYWSY